MVPFVVVQSGAFSLQLHVLFLPGVALKENPAFAVNTDSKRACNRLRGHPPVQEKHGNDAACEFNL